LKYKIQSGLIVSQSINQSIFI